MEMTVPECKKARKEASRSILDVPDCVLGDIFTRLPIATILNCKRVCKSLYFTLSDPEFSKAYHKKPPFTSIVISLGNSAFCLLELNADNSYTIKRNSPQIFRNPPGFSKGSVRLLGSCNGLLLFLDNYSPERRDNLYISNPLLGEYALLPQPIEVLRVDDEAYGFGYSPKTGHYKVLRIIRRKWRPGKTEVHVCTIGVDEKWRIVGDNAPFPQANKYMEGRALGTSRFFEVNGAIHWIVEDLKRPDFIYSFVIGEEKVRPIPPPPSLSRRNWKTRLGVLSGCLCVFHSDGHPDLDIWCMKEYGVTESWNRTVMLGCSSTAPMFNDTYYPILMWTNGEILMSRCIGRLISYNPTTKLSTELTVKLDKHGMISSVPFIPSFLSLEESLNVQHIERVGRGQGLMVKDERSRISLMGKPENPVLTILQLPTNIFADILSRLDFTIYRCMFVCKTWYNFISDPYFGKTYFRNRKDVNLLLSNGASVYCCGLKADDENGVQPNIEKVFERSTRFNGSTQTFLGSCNGLICLSYSCSENQYLVYIFNPLLQEYEILPQPNVCSPVRDEAYGFGFSPASGCYKVLRILSIKQRPDNLEAQVHTVGIDKVWRRVEYHAPFAIPRKWQKSKNKARFSETTLNGALHWIPEDHKNVDFICSFDFGVEEFRPIPPPPGMGQRNSHTSVGVLRDCLCIFDSSSHLNLDIWWMKEYGVLNSWTKESILLSDITVRPNNRHVVVPIMSLRNGEILMSVGAGRLISYCPVKKRSKEIMINFAHDKYVAAAAAPYTTTFVSPKSAGRRGAASWTR